jgi:predicted ester cyclase
LQTPSGGSIPPTGKSPVVMGSTTSEVKDGKIIHSWTFWDMAALLGQLGLLPPM